MGGGTSCNFQLSVCPEGGPPGSYIHRTKSWHWNPGLLSQLTVPLCLSMIPGAHWIIQPGRQWDLDFRMEWLGQFLMGLFIRLPSCWLAFVWGWSGKAWGLLLTGVTVASRGWVTFPWFPTGWLKANARVGHSLVMWPPLAPKALERIWVQPIGCALPPCVSPLVNYPLLPFPVSPVPHLVGKLWARVICSGPLLTLWEFGNGDVTTIVSPPMASLPWATRGTRGVVTLPHLG